MFRYKEYLTKQENKLYILLISFFKNIITLYTMWLLQCLLTSQRYILPVINSFCSTNAMCKAAIMHLKNICSLAPIVASSYMPKSQWKYCTTKQKIYLNKEPNWKWLKARELLFCIESCLLLDVRPCLPKEIFRL